jgi:hypothetical protein
MLSLDIKLIHMMRRMAAGALAALFLLGLPAGAQWLDHKKPGVPRTADGKPDLNAPAPRTPDGKPDLSGVWMGDQWNPAGKRPNSAAAAKPEGPTMLPWAEKVFAERRANGGKDNPEARCMPQGIPYASTLPYPFEIVNAPGKVLVLYEMYSLRRQIFTDSRELPKEFLSPSWMGYSVGRWEGDEFLVETAGFNGQVWNIDLAGHPHSDTERVIERFHRISYGYMDVQVTIDDPKTYAKPWVMPLMKYTMLPDTDLLEFVCEKNIDPQHMVGK